MQLYGDVAEQYVDFARYATDSPCLADWATQVAADEELCGWIGALPPLKQQPNLVFAAARWHGVPAPGDYADFREALLTDDGTITGTILARATQTNEVGRLATLMPFFAQLAAAHGPIALLEVGASAGLCLYPDRYAYRWTMATEASAERAGGRPGSEPTERSWRPHATAMLDGDEAPELTCRVSQDGIDFAAPHALPVVWRGGLDLSPVDVLDDDAMAWLEILVWPEQHERRRRLHEAIAIAQSDPPQVRRGDLTHGPDLDELVAEAAEYGTVVVFHSAVVAYLEPAAREHWHDEMTERVRAGRCHWVSNEGKNVLPRLTATGPTIPADHPTFVLGVDGQARAWTHGHGSSMRLV